MIAVFLDTAGLLALWDTSDQWHAAADKAYCELREGRRGLVTTTFVLLECGNAAARRPYRAAVDELRQRMESSGMLITPGEEDWREAWAAYRRGEGAGPVLSITSPSGSCGGWASATRLRTTITFGQRVSGHCSETTPPGH